MALKKSGKVWEDVNLLLEKHGVYDDLKKAGLDPTSMAICSFGRGPNHDVVIDDRVIGVYNHIAEAVTLTDQEGEPLLWLYKK